MNRSPELTFENIQRYDSLDGLRAYVTIGIILIHVLANIGIKPSDNFLTSTLIPYLRGFHFALHDNKWIFATP